MKIRLEFPGAVTVIPEYVGNGALCVIDEDLSDGQVLGVVKEALRTGAVLAEDIIDSLNRKVLLEWAEKQGLHY